jgi:meiotically up-regulated gene 157 (Mug157) protein
MHALYCCCLVESVNCCASCAGCSASERYEQQSTALGLSPVVASTAVAAAVQVYANTRRRILSSSNPYHYSGSAFSGLGSPHTPPQYIWPLAIMVQGLTSSDPYEQAGLLQMLLRMQCGNGLMHESVHVSGS